MNLTYGNTDCIFSNELIRNYHHFFYQMRKIQNNHPHSGKNSSFSLRTTLSAVEHDGTKLKFDFEHLLTDEIKSLTLID